MAGELTAEQVRKIAALAGLALTDEQVPGEAGRLSAVLGHMACLDELDLEGVEPMTAVGGDHSRLRADEPGDTLTSEQAVGLAPDAHEDVDGSGDGVGRYFKVPKVIGGGGA